MTSPAAQPAPTFGAFQSTVEAAAVQLTALRLTASHALRNGVIPQEIVDFARGQLSPGQRQDAQAMLARSPWAMGRVVALVKARRDGASLGARILASTGPVDPVVWGISPTDDKDADLAKLLDVV